MIPEAQRTQYGKVATEENKKIFTAETQSTQS